MNINILINKKIYLTPYNDVSINLEKNLEQKNISISGYIDKNKTGHNIFKESEILDYDYIIVASPNYWIEITKNIKNKIKIILFFSKLYNYMEYIQSLKEEIKYEKYDICFMPHNKAHALDLIPIIKQLQKTTTFNISFVDITKRYRDEGAKKEILQSNIHYIHIDILRLNLVIPKMFICMNTWDKNIAKPLIEYYNKINVITVGIIEGITDFTDVDYISKRNVYQNVHYVFSTGKNDLQYLNKKNCFIVGIPKMLKLWNKNKIFPKKIVIVINLSFLGLTYNDYGSIWLNEVINTCNELNLDYIISKHPNDKTDTKNFNVTDKTIYEILDEGSLLVSRFSTTILESIALGKPAVYFKPQPEKTTLYDNNFGAFSIAYNKEELKEKILYELEHKDNVRERANKFLDLQCNINEQIKPEVLATEYIREIIEVEEKK